jgi:hypothetical protein
MGERVFPRDLKSVIATNTQQRRDVFEFGDSYCRTGNAARGFVEAVDTLGKAVDV